MAEESSISRLLSDVETNNPLAPSGDRAVAKSENPGGHVVLGGDNVPPLVEIGLADLPKSGGARAPPAPPLATGLRNDNPTSALYVYLEHKTVFSRSK